MSQKRISSLNWLRVFEAAARTENFKRAAELLNMSAPAVSQQIQALEDNLGRRLFVRAPQKVVLTESGRAFLPVVQQALGSLETTAAALFGADGGETITLQAVTVLAMGWLPACVAGFEAAHPGTRVNIITGNMIADFRAIMPGREPDLQIAFGSATDFPETATRLFGETLHAVASPGIAGAIARPRDLRDHILLEVATHRSGWHQILTPVEGVDLRSMRFRMLDTTPLALMFAHTGQGIALARAPATDPMAAALGLKTLDFVPPVRGLQAY
ncbi:MAG: LysR family transcriptional regulator, partial [Planctomycetes bacterium]|nr:LysR family transcriptional regulator [Planctomycetota bacterium]